MMHTACWVSRIINVTDNVAVLTATEDDVGPVWDVMV